MVSLKEEEYFVIFGAAIRPDGSPSGTLKRRVRGAVDAASNNADATFVPSGGIGRHGPAEAEVMAGLLRDAGIPKTRIIEDRDAGDTFDSAVNVARIVRLRSNRFRIVVCSSGYHNPRCALLFWLLGIPVRIPRMPSDRQHLGLMKWAYFCLREIPALLWDGIFMLARRRGLGIT